MRNTHGGKTHLAVLRLGRFVESLCLLSDSCIVRYCRNLKSFDCFSDGMFCGIGLVGNIIEGEAGRVYVCRSGLKNPIVGTCGRVIQQLSRM